MSPFLAPEGRLGDERVDLARRAFVEFDEAVDLSADEVIEVEVRRAAGAEVQAVGRLEQQLVFEECVDAFPARQAHRLQCRAAEKNGNGGTLDLERA
jgi:hypothetical protein